MYRFHSVLLLFVLMSALLIVSCATVPKDQGAAQANGRGLGNGFRLGNGGSLNGGRVEDHVWETLRGFGLEDQENYGFYTYVLFPRRTSQPDKLSAAARQRYNAVIKSIIVGKGSRDIDAEDHPLFNIFYIPGKQDYLNVTGELITNYDENLGFKYLEVLRKAGVEQDLRERIRRSEGPFLVSSYFPLKKTDKETILLYADLSSTNVAGIEEVIATYKSHIIENDIDESERFFSLRTFLLSRLLDADDYISIIKVSLADLPG